MRLPNYVTQFDTNSATIGIQTADTSLIGTDDRMTLSCVSKASTMPSTENSFVTYIDVAFKEEADEEAECSKDEVTFLSDLQDLTIKADQDVTTIKPMLQQSSPTCPVECSLIIDGSSTSL